MEECAAVQLLAVAMYGATRFSSVAAAKVVSCLVIAAIVFASAYALARLLGQSRAVAVAAGWILGFVATPLVPIWFFYPVLFITREGDESRNAFHAMTDFLNAFETILIAQIIPEQNVLLEK